MEVIQISFLPTLCAVSAVALSIIYVKKLLFVTTSHIAATVNGSLLPKGSYGIPFIGETIQFVCSDPVAFCKPRMKKYGEVFKTHLLGKPTIMVTCPNVAKRIFVDSQQQFKFKYPFYFDHLLGDGGPGYPPETRNLVYRAVKTFFSPDVLRFKVADIESMTRDTLLAWAARGTVESVEKEIVKFSMSVGIRFILGLRSEHLLALKLQHEYERYSDGLQCLPIKLPGTQYSRAFKAKEAILKELNIFVEKRAESGKDCHQTDGEQRDLLDVILQFLGKENDVGGLGQYVIAILYAARDTVAFTTLWAMMLLWESPEALQAVTMENDAIRRRKDPGAPLTWSDIKEMKYSSRVVQEALRISSLATGPARKAIEDVNFGGYVIPKNWDVMIMLPAIHKSAEYFPDPLTFDPSRFEALDDKGNDATSMDSVAGGHKAPLRNTFMPFGSGRHACGGTELAKLEILTVLHVLTTEFCWERIGKNCEILSYPWPRPRDGFPIKIRSKTPSDG